MMVAVREENNGSEDRIIAIAAQSRVPIVVKPCDASLTHVPLRFDSFERTLLLLLLLLLLLSLSSLAFLRLISFPLDHAISTSELLVRGILCTASVASLGSHSLIKYLRRNSYLQHKILEPIFSLHIQLQKRPTLRA